MVETIQNWLVDYGMNEVWAEPAATAVALLAVLLLGVCSYYVARRPVLAAAEHIISKSSTRLDDILVQTGFFHRLCHLVPAIIIYLIAPVALEGYPKLNGITNNIVFIYLTIMVVLAVDASLNAVIEAYEGRDTVREIPIKSFVQVVKIVLYLIGLILLISIMLDKTPFYLLSGLGALTAVLMLIFKDPILGFVAGIQLTANKMVAKGDWISMPQYSADGFVIDLALTTVKIQNWDKTITTVPTYALISESFKNWRGMFAAGGRRIQRSIHIDMNTVKLCTEEMLQRFARIEHIKEYLARKREEVAKYNAEHHVDESSLVNGRRLTNIGTFRAYVMAYLRSHPDISQDLTFLVRQLQPTDRGLPLEIYVFSKQTSWADYENIQADIFDHILAVVPQFDLRVYQMPSGSDVQRVLTPNSDAAAGNTP